MLELLDKFSPGHLIGLAATVLGILGWIVTTVASQWRRVRVAEIEASLKQQMLERGLGPNDIEQVLRTSRKGSCGTTFEGTPSSAKAVLVKTLSENDYTGADIERVLRAFGRHPDPQAVAQKEGPQRAEALGRALSAKVGVVKTMAENGNEAEDIERVLSAFADDADWRLDRQPAPARV